MTNFDIVYFASPDPLTGAVRDTPYAPIYVVLDGASEQEAFAFEFKKEDIGRAQGRGAGAARLGGEAHRQL